MLGPVPKASPPSERPDKGLLSCIVTAEQALLDDGMLTSSVLISVEKLLSNAHDVSTEAARMPDGTTHDLSSTNHSIHIFTNNFQGRTFFAVFSLTSYFIMFGNQRHEDYKVRNDNTSYLVTLRKDGRRIEYRTNLELLDY